MPAIWHVFYRRFAFHKFAAIAVTDFIVTNVLITINGEQVAVPADVTLAGALYSLQRRHFRTTPVDGLPRSLFCGMGLCFDCVVKVNGRGNVRSCQIQVKHGMLVDTQHGESDLDGSK